MAIRMTILTKQFQVYNFTYTPRRLCNWTTICTTWNFCTHRPLKITEEIGWLSCLVYFGQVWNPLKPIHIRYVILILAFWVLFT